LLRAHDAKNRDHVRVIAPVVRVHLRSLIGGGQGEAARGLNGFKRRLATLRDEMEVVLNNRTQETLQTTYLMNGVALVLALILFIAVLIGLRPVRSLTEGVRQMARGDLDAEIPVKSHDEIGQLAHEFNEMARALKKQQGALVRAERLAAVGKMAANVAHEIRNPLNAIALNLELIEDAVGSGSPEEMQPLLSAVGKEVQRLTDVTEAYLRFSGLPQPYLEPIDLSSVVRDLVSFQSEEARQMGVAIQIDAPANMAAQADPDQLRQALLNMIKNAIEATPDKGHILVRLEGDDHTARVIVEDDGQGVEEHMLEQIFEPFVSTKKHGTGLGLALARRVAEAHFGSLKLLHTPSGRRGARFQFEIERGDWNESG
jgi:signal transduction histidine kinase